MSRRDDSNRAAPAAALAVLAAIVACAGLGAAGASAGVPQDTVAPPRATTLSASASSAYWTPERVAAARPLALAGGAGTEVRGRRSAGRLRLLAPQRTTLRSSSVDHPERYPNRVHGKLVGTYPGIGDYSCSGTVVSSGSGSLVMTAGHCLYDAGESNEFASNLAFAPGYSKGKLPYGIWTATNGITTRQWVRRGALDYDVSMLRFKPSAGGTLEHVVGSRGIGFNQPRKQRLSAFGYPARGKPRYDGYHLIRCDSGYVGDPFRNGGPQSRGMHCDQQQGSSGGGWVSQHSFVVSNTSHGYPQLSHKKFYGPYYGGVIKSLYRAKGKGWPSIGPVRCNGKVASIVATNHRDRIRGTRGPDVIATLGGDDSIKGKGGRDVICAGSGNDRISGGGGRDRITGGDGRDRCGSRKGGNKLKACESPKKHHGHHHGG